MKRLLTATALTLLMASPGIARENWAILIGASVYDNLDEKYWLRGPENDMELVHGYLTANPTARFDDGNIIILADNFERARARATLQAIRDAFAEIAAKAGPGDFVYLHFSGHGTQAPALDPSTELDGLDELFLPVDVGAWDNTVGHVENALVDDEIGAMIDAIRAKGANVFAVFDSCHSGTATRAVSAGDDDEVRMRQLSPDVLGLTSAELDRAEAAARDYHDVATRGMAPPDPRDRPEPPVDASTGDGLGGFVYFYAAQTNEPTPEQRLPKGDPTRKAQGVFTFTIFQTLAESPGITYRQLAQEVLRKYSVYNLTRTTPLFEGEMDALVFGMEGADLVQQWPARVSGGRLTIDAGRLHGIKPGERLAILGSPVDSIEDALGWAVAESADTFGTVLTPEDGMAAAGIPKGAVIRKVEDSIDYTLTIALPEGGDGPAGLMRAAAAILAADEESGRRLRFVEPGEEADLRLVVIPGRARPDAIWMLPGSGMVEAAAGEDLDTALSAMPSVGTAGRDAETLAELIGENLTRMARAINLMKLGAAAGSSGLEVKAELSRVRYDERQPTFVDETTRALLDGANVPRLVPDDIIGARLENTTDQPVDFNILYIGADYSITWMGNGRLQPGGVLREDYVHVTDEHFGRDRMVIVVTPAEPGSDTEDLRFLEQTQVMITRGFGSDFKAALWEAGFGDTTRSATRVKRRDPADTRRPVILQFEIDTVPG